MVTKQQQLDWLAKHIEKWKSGHTYTVVEESTDGSLYVRWPTICTSGITKKEWRQEREKMQKQHDFDIGSNLKVSVAATSNGFGEMKINTLWYEREELPPIGVPVELWFGATFAYNCELIASRGHNYIVWNLDADRPDCADHLNTTFRPLRTEREKAIEEMSRLMHEHDSVINDITLGALYDAGYRKVGVRPGPI